MIDIQQLTSEFHDKLKVTGSFDDAFKKAVWIAYKAGYKDGESAMTPHVTPDFDMSQKR